MAQSRHATAINRYEFETALGGETRDRSFLCLVQEDEAYIVTRGRYSALRSYFGRSFFIQARSLRTTLEFPK